MSRDYHYPTDSACAGHPFPQWWDQSIDGEDRFAQTLRHRAALDVCRRRCPVRAACEADIQPGIDEGIKGGRELGPLEKQKLRGYGQVSGIRRADYGRKRAS